MIQATVEPLIAMAFMAIHPGSAAPHSGLEPEVLRHHSKQGQHPVTWPQPNANTRGYLYIFYIQGDALAH